MEKEVLRAKTILLTCFAIAFAIDVFFVSIGQNVGGGVRLLLTLLLMYFVYNGHTWAKWVFIALAVASGFLGVMVSKNLSDAGYMGFALFLGLNAFFWLALGLFILKSENLAQYFQLQKEKRQIN